jgi:hypothetical protein
MTTRPNAARLIAQHQAGEELPRQLTRDEIREVLEEAAEARNEREAAGAWLSELAHIAKLAGYPRATSPDFGEVDMVNLADRVEALRERAEKAEAALYEPLSRADLITALRADLTAGMCPEWRTECVLCQAKRRVLQALDALERCDVRCRPIRGVLAAFDEVRHELERKSTPVADDAAPSAIADAREVRDALMDAWIARHASTIAEPAKPEPWVPKVGDVVEHVEGFFDGASEVVSVTSHLGGRSVVRLANSFVGASDRVRLVREGSR